MHRLDDRVYASIPDDDPRFVELRAYLSQVKSFGRSSPIPRIMGEFALVGFLFMTGRIGGISGAADLASFGVSDPLQFSADQRSIAEAASGFDFS